MTRPRHSQAGITLLEMLVVLAIIVLVAGALTVGYARLPATALKREATRMAATMRAAYDRATASGAHHRLVIDMGQGTYVLERCEGKVQLRKSRDLQEEMERIRTDAEKAQQVAASQTGDQIMDGMVKDVAATIGATATCAPVPGPLGKKQSLGGHPQVTFSKIHVAHLEEPAKTGEVTINFFPLGTAERAVIVLGVGEEDFFSVAVKPLSGRIEMTQGEWRDVEDLVTKDAEEKDVK